MELANHRIDTRLLPDRTSRSGIKLLVHTDKCAGQGEAPAGGLLVPAHRQQAQCAVVQCEQHDVHRDR
jgi:hypothetical protein